MRRRALLLAIITAFALAVPAVSHSGTPQTNGRGVGRTYWYRDVIGPCGQLQCIYQDSFKMFGRLKLNGRTFFGAFTIDSPGEKSLLEQWSAVALHGRDRLGHRIAGVCYVNLAPSGIDYFLDCAGAIDGAAETGFGISMQILVDPVGILSENGVYPGTWVV